MTTQQKIHQHLLDSIRNILKEIFHEQRYSDKVLEKNFKAHRKWGSRDRKFVAETVYEIVRWHRLYQSLGQHWGKDVVEVHLSRPEWEKSDEVAVLPRALRQSIPDWLDELGQNQYGPRWESVLKSLNQKADVDLRVNTLKSNRTQLMKQLAAEDINTEPIADSEIGLVLPERKNVFSTNAFKDGFFEVQDRASQRVAPLTQVQPGMRVVDACAGAGGKSLHLAALMKNKGKILSLDIHEWKLKELRVRASRAGADIIETRLIDTSKVIKRLHESADVVLLDVPCSGLGVLRRNPDSKWKLSLEEIERLKILQKDLLDRYSLMAKPGGTIVYATCSFLRSENEDQVDRFVAESAGAFELVETLRVDPEQGRGDGFFAARMLRKS